MLNLLIKPLEAITTFVLNRFMSRDHNINGSHRLWIDAKNYASLSAAIDACGAAGSKSCTLAITNNQALPSNKTVLPHVVLWRSNSGKITFSGGAILTIQGGLISDGLQQFFFGTGTVVLDTGFIDKTYPQLWGAKGDGVTDDTTAITATLNAAINGIPVKFVPGTYIFDQLDLLEKGTILGSGPNLTILKRKAGGSGGVAFDSTGDADDIVLKDFTLDCNSEGTNGIDLGNGTGTWGGNGLIENVPVINCPGSDLIINSNGGQVKNKVNFLVNMNGTDQVVSTGVDEVMEWGAVEFDLHGFFDLATERWLPKIAGRYPITMTLHWVSVAVSNKFNVYIKKNGTTIKRKTIIMSITTSNMSQSIDCIVDMNGTTDYLEIWAGHIAGSDRSIEGNVLDTWFAGHLAG